MTQSLPEFAHYPDADTLEAIITELWSAAGATPCEAEMLGERGFPPQAQLSHMRGYTFVRFVPEGLTPFYGYWQPAPARPAPLLVHLPGYGAEVSLYPDLVMQGYNVLHINPLGYMTPHGPDESLRHGGEWPVFAETIFSEGRVGYRQWFLNCLQAVAWAQRQEAVLPERLSFFGTSQGGGAALLLASIFRGRGVRCVAADQPWLVNFPMCQQLRPDWASTVFEEIAALEDASSVWSVLGAIDALTHAHRLDIPVLLTAGGNDHTCPPPMIASLFERLPGTRAYVYLHNKGHQYTQEFAALAAAWFRLYA